MHEDGYRVNSTEGLTKGHLVGLMLLARNSRMGLCVLLDGIVYCICDGVRTELIDTWKV